MEKKYFYNYKRTIGYKNLMKELKETTPIEEDFAKIDVMFKPDNMHDVIEDVLVAKYGDRIYGD